MESVKKWRKKMHQSGFPGGDKGSELDLAFEDGSHLRSQAIRGQVCLVEIGSVERQDKVGR
ncbi:unnamed protein product [Prunus armeniaca]|uniref:Uncharacterized protein n=1 Tax=Prunus armeniaca TaxID=36596 RepID=A0A6J5WK92_PRUAR|nr:unnamed protein product [Prunus armeniaca]